MIVQAGPPSAVTLTVVQQAGQGVATTHAGSYPLGPLQFVHASNGRGIVSLKAGSGRFDLSGGEADDLGGGRWRLHIDRAQIVTPAAATGTCELVSREAPPTYVSLRCRVLLSGDPAPITVEWRGDGTQTQRLR